MSPLGFSGLSASKPEFQSELDLPRRIQRRVHLAAVPRIDVPRRRIERGVVENVKEFGAELELLGLGNAKAFTYSKIQLLEAIGSQDVSPTGSVPAISSPRIGWEGE